MVVTVCSSEDEFQVLAMRLAARVLLPGTGCYWSRMRCGSHLVKTYVTPAARTYTLLQTTGYVGELVIRSTKYFSNLNICDITQVLAGIHNL